MTKSIFLVLASLILSGSLVHATQPTSQAVKIDFISIGAGIDHKAKKQVLALIKQYQTDGKVASVSDKSWGHQGELTYCVQLNDWRLALEFDQDVEALVNASNLVTHQRVLNCSVEVIDPKE